MLVQYNDVLLEQAEIISLQRHTVWDDSHTDILYIEWDIGVVAQYAPLGYPPGVTAGKLRPRLPVPVKSKNTEFGADVTSVIEAATAVFLGAVNALVSPFKKFKKLLFGADAAPSPVVQRHPDTQTAANPLSDIAFAEPRWFGPILTDVTFRNRLMAKGKKLFIFGWDYAAIRPESLDDNGLVVLLESPKGEDKTDANNGPHPIALDIISGEDASFAVYFQIKTVTLPCDDNSDRLILSHRWQVSHTHDEDQYLTRMVEGEIVFNGAMVNTLGLNIDHVRSQFFQPIPLGCYRTVEHVTPSVDGLTLNYHYSDHDQTIVFDAGDSGATRIEIAEKLGYYMPWLIADLLPDNPDDRPATTQ